jgi:hypothetical protein
VVNDDGSASIGFAASGDTNLDGLVDILDVSAMLAAGRFNTGDATTWAEGDTNYDGLIDVLDIGDVLASGHFNAGPYIPLPASQAAATSSTITPTMAAFAAFWADTAAGNGTAAVPGPRRTRLGGPVA